MNVENHSVNIPIADYLELIDIKEKYQSIKHLIPTHENKAITLEGFCQNLSARAINVIKNTLINSDEWQTNAFVFFNDFKKHDYRICRNAGKKSMSEIENELARLGFTWK